MKKLFGIFLFLFSCRDTSSNLTEFSGSAMTMEYRILVENPRDQEIVDLIKDTFSEIDAIYNKWNPDSEISKINRWPKNIPFKLSKKLESFLIATEKFVRLTEGKFDPTIEPLQRIWKTSIAENRLPTIEELEKTLGVVGWDKIKLKNGFLIKEYEGIELDLGGIAKGFGVDLFAKGLMQKGYRNFFIEWGGEIRASGQHPSGRPWKVAISKLGSKEEAAFLELVNQAVATSGDYAQSWQIEIEKGNKITCFHIIDPHTGKFLERGPSTIASASVVANDCMTADVLASYLMTFKSKEEAESFASSCKNLDPSIKIWVYTRNDFN